MSSVMTAVFTAMAVVMSTVAGIRIPILGADGLKISFGGIFTFFPAIMFGPIYGGISSALCDIIGCIIKPTGPYIPWFTIVAFIGGYLKGLIWQVLVKKKEWKLTSTVRTVLICVFAVVLATGGAFMYSLKSDGLIGGVVAVKSELPFEDEMQTRELSALSRFAATLARYNHDTLTVTDITVGENGECVLPKKLVSGETSLSIKKLNADLLNKEGLTRLYIPSSYTGISLTDSFVLTNKSLELVFEKKSDGTIAEDMKSFVENEKHGINYSLYEGDDFPQITLRTDSFSSNYDINGVDIKSSDAYRKNLAGYINFLAIGFILTGALGLVFILGGVLITKLFKKKESERTSIYMKVLPSVLISGLTVTTINTYVLLELFYAGRLFWILYIPRLAEELFMNVVQAYIITLLLTVLSSHSLFRKYIGITPKNKEDKPLTEGVTESEPLPEEQSAENNPLPEEQSSEEPPKDKE